MARPACSPASPCPAPVFRPLRRHVDLASLVSRCSLPCRERASFFCPLQQGVIADEGLVVVKVLAAMRLLVDRLQDLLAKVSFLTRPAANDEDEDRVELTLYFLRLAEP